MAIGPGSRLGPYEVTALIGEGGMGKVWRAHHTGLKRDDALKVLPDTFVSDPERLARFQREAQVLASLNHPNIAHVHGLERADGVQALVMELVEGPTLADRIAQGPIPVEDALPIAKQIAEALEAAHGQGIIHRDLKPANIKVRSDGTVKVLDFGLAKTLEPMAARADATASPTITSPAMMTGVGVLLGTAAYMSPEQARGLAVDSRTDVWSFGVVLYEMLAGASLFEGHTVSDTLAAVLRADPDWNRLPATLPPAFRQLVHRCLQRDLKRRLQHIGDARLEIDDLQVNRVATAAELKAPYRWGLVTSAALFVAAVVGPLAWTLKPLPPTGPATKFVIRTVSDAPVSQSAPLALSSDGRQLVYGVGLSVQRRLVYQSLDTFDPRPLEGTNEAAIPFFLPRGDAIAFHNPSVGQIHQLPLAGGAATRLVDSPEMWGASGGDNGSIVFVRQWGQPLRISRLAPSESTDLTTVDRAAGEGAHLWPQFLPGNRAVLFTIWSGAPTLDEAQLGVVDLATGRHQVVLRGGTFGRYAASGHLVFWRGSALWAAPFDLEALKVTGEAVRVVPDVRLNLITSDAHFTLSQTGTLAYVKGREETFAETFIVDRSGKRLPLDETESVGAPRFSPDGKRVAVHLYRRGTFGVGVYDRGRGLMEPIALTGDNPNPAWRDNDLIAFQCSDSEGGYAICSSPIGGGGKPERFFPKTQSMVPGLTSAPDGRHLVGTRNDEKTGFDLWQYQLVPQADSSQLIATMANESHPAISPKGNFIAYQSDESGSLEVFVQKYPKVDAWRRRVSSAGGSRPRWSHDGRAILYVSDNGIMTVPISLGRDEADVLTLGQPSLALSMTGLTTFDVSPDGSFAIERIPIEKASKEINVVLNWFEELRRLVPTN